MTPRARLSSWWPVVLFAGIAAAFLWRPLFAGEAFVPAGLFSYAAPWSDGVAEADRPPWNPLMYDSAGQFYPWRKFASDELRAGRIPLWNPYSFCGAPLLANSQSAVLYPPNWLHVLLGPARASGWLACLHLVLAASFLCLLLRRLGCGNAAGALGGVVYAFSGWQISWLHLPTFLATSCWIPLGVLLALRLAERPSARRATALGAALGAMLLAGHLQIAFYGLMAAALAAIAGIKRERAAGALVGLGAAIALASAIAAPQLLPSIELSRQSHRAAPASEAGYQAYVGYAPPLGSLVTLLSPDAFGNPSDGTNPYFGLSRAGMYFNYAEGALYVGSVGLLLGLLGLLGLVRQVRQGQANLRAALLFGGTALLALLIAFGSPLDRLLYFAVPGFSQSGSPGRALVLWAFGTAALAGFGLERLKALASARPLAPLLAVGGLIVAGWAYLLASSAPRLAQRASLFGDLPAPEASFAPYLGLFALGALGAAGVATRRIGSGAGCALLTALVCAELLLAGGRFNPSASGSLLFPETELTRTLRQIAGHDRIAPVNGNWSFLGPRAILPPNASLALRLRDVQGYDSLFPGRYKALMNRAAAPESDASPREVGNMVFAKNGENPLLDSMGVRVVASLAPLSIPGAEERFIGGVYLAIKRGAPGRASMTGSPDARAEWIDDLPNRVALRTSSTGAARLRLADQNYAGWKATIGGKPVPIRMADGVFREVEVPAGENVVEFRFQPSSFRVGLFAMFAGIGVLAAVLSNSLVARTFLSGNDGLCNHPMNQRD